MNKDEAELASLLERDPTPHNQLRSGRGERIAHSPTESGSMPHPFPRELVQWTSGNGKSFIPSAKSLLTLPPGLYDIMDNSQIGIYFDASPMKVGGIVRFPDAASDRVLNEIMTFWDREALYTRHDIFYKRGILLWGPPGSGKTSTVRLILHDLFQRGGIAIKFCSPGKFVIGMKMLREIEADTPVVVLMEDIDSLVQAYAETDVINILDGVDTIRKVVFLATTNYPEMLGARIVNRPSRFDTRIKIDLPSDQARRIYLNSLIKNHDLNIDIDTWVADTKGMSIAHVQELFTKVAVLDDSYEDTLERLKAMSRKITSEGRTIAMMGER